MSHPRFCGYDSWAFAYGLDASGDLIVATHRGVEAETDPHSLWTAPELPPYVLRLTAAGAVVAVH